MSSNIQISLGNSLSDPLSNLTRGDGLQQTSSNNSNSSVRANNEELYCPRCIKPQVAIANRLVPIDREESAATSESSSSGRLQREFSVKVKGKTLRVIIENVRESLIILKSNPNEEDVDRVELTKPDVGTDEAVNQASSQASSAEIDVVVNAYFQRTILEAFTLHDLPPLYEMRVTQRVKGNPQQEISDQFFLLEIAITQWNKGAYSQAFDLFSRAISIPCYKDNQKAYFQAEYLLGRCYENGLAGKTDCERALDFYVKAAVGNVDAQYHAGRCYFKGIGTKQSLVKAVKYIEAAKNAKQKDALFLWGEWLENSMRKILKVDCDNPLIYYAEAAKKGSVQALLYMGRSHATGEHGVPLNLESARVMFENVCQHECSDGYNELGLLDEKKEAYVSALINYQKAIILGNREALWHIGRLYDKHLMNRSTCLNYYKEAISKGDYSHFKYLEQYYKKYLQKNAESAEALDVSLLLGEGLLMKDGGVKEKGLDYLKKVIDVTDSSSKSIERKASAMNILGMFFEKGIFNQCFDCEIVTTRTVFSLYQQAAELCNVNAIINLARCYELGIGTQQELTLAFKNYLLANVMKNNQDPCVLLQIARCYEHGIGVEKDEQKAFEIYRIAASSDDANAQLNVGRCLALGIGTIKNSREAFALFRQIAVAEKGETDGYDLLGFCYENGIGITKDYKKAFEYYQRSADCGSTLGMVNVGRFYEAGEALMGHSGAVRSDVVKAEARRNAIKWYFKAAINHDRNGLLHLMDCYDVTQKAIEVDEVKYLIFLIRKFLHENDKENVVKYTDHLLALEIKPPVFEHEYEEYYKYLSSLVVIGHLYNQGSIVDQSEVKAKLFYQKAER